MVSLRRYTECGVCRIVLLETDMSLQSPTLPLPENSDPTPHAEGTVDAPETRPSIHDSEHPRSDESIAADEPPLDEGAPPTMIQPG